MQPNPKIQNCLQACADWGLIPTEFKQCMTWEEQVLWLFKFLNNTVIPAVNTDIANIESLAESFAELEAHVDEYFDNLDVQTEINNKLDQMVSDGTMASLLEQYVQPLINEQNQQISQLNTRFNEVSQRINNAFASAPTPVDSVEDMTDTTKVYLLTTTGHWFYYDADNSEWVDGGDYQSAIISEKSITPSEEAQFEGYNLRLHQYSTPDWTVNGVTINDAGVISNASQDNKAIRCRLIPNTFVTIKRSALTNTFKVGLANTKPVNGVTTDLINTNADLEYVTFYTGSYQWVIVQTSTSAESCTVDVIVENYDKIERTITAKNLMPFVPVPAETELYNPNLKVAGKGTKPDFNKYAYATDSSYRSYVFALVDDANYTIEQTGGDIFRVCLWFDMPKLRVDDSDTGSNSIVCRPAEVIIDSTSTFECTFNSGNYKYCTILYAKTPGASDATFSIKCDKETYELSKQWYSVQLDDNGAYIFNPEVNALADYWSLWSGRLAFGMNTEIAPVPVQMNSQLFVNGTIIAHNNSASTASSQLGYNRWGLHIYEGYARDNYSRMTILTDKHTGDFGDSKKDLEFYYYTGADHKESSYADVKIGSDVNKHSFVFNRDKMIAGGVIDCLYPIQIARINPETDLDDTYTTVANADNAYEAEGNADANIKCLKWIYLHNATNGAMFYDNARNKLVVKIGNEWCDVNTTPVQSGTYDF